MNYDGSIVKSIDIITPFLNGSRYLDVFLNSLAELKCPDGVVVNSYIIDNGSDDHSADMLDAYPSRLLNGVNLHPLYFDQIKSSYAARNFGVRASSSDLLLFTDIDCKPDVNWLLECLRNIEFNAIYSGKVSFFCESNSCFEKTSGIFDSNYFLRNDLNAKNTTGVTANAFMLRSTFEHIGYFDEITSGGDHAYFVRAKKACVKFRYIDSAIVEHPTRTFNELVIKLERISQGVKESDQHIFKSKELLKIVFNPILFRLIRVGSFHRIGVRYSLTLILISTILNFKYRRFLISSH